jgi:hypothetical protein
MLDAIQSLERRLRAAAANATTGSLRARLLEEAEQQERLADKISKLD